MFLFDKMMLFLIQIVYGCDVLTDQLNIYPTVGTTYTLLLYTIFVGQNLTYQCDGCPDSVQFYNQLNKVYDQKVEFDITRNMNSNRTHFVTLTEQQTANLFVFENYSMKLVHTIQINEDLYCFNAFFTLTNLIVLDCYDSDNQLQFYFFNTTSFISYQTINNSIRPTKTTVISVISQTQLYLLYAQFFDGYQLLTLFSQVEVELKNLTTWTKGISDLTASLKGFIYIINFEGIYQVQINLDNFEILELFVHRDELVKIEVSQSENFNSQCDNLVVATLNQSQPLLSYQAWNSSIMFLGPYLFSDLNFTNETLIQIQISQNFLIVQYDNFFIITSMATILYESKEKNNVVFKNLHNKTQIYTYLDVRNNYLFEFSDGIEVYTLKSPQLSGIFPGGGNTNIIISATEIYYPFLNSFCQIEITYKLLEKNDTNIYLLYNNSVQLQVMMQNATFQQELTEFSGPLLNSSGILSNPSLGYFEDITFNELFINFQYEFVLTKLFYVKNRGLAFFRLFLVGTTQNSIYFYFCHLNFECQQIYYDLQIYQATQIQISYYYSYNLMVAINQGIGQILVYNLNFFNYTANNEGIILVTNQTISCQQYQQFLLNYENIIVLLNPNEILIKSMSTSEETILNSQKMSLLFSNFNLNKFDFHPSNIALDEQNQASTLYINNRNSVIIVVIINTKKIIPISIIQVNFTIYQLNILNNQLIMSYFVEELICFSVWKVYDITQPYYYSDLPCIQMKDNWNIESDDIFLYVLSEDNIMSIVNTALSYHSSQYYQLQFKGNYVSTVYLGNFAIISFQNQLFQLHAATIQQLKAISSNITENQQYISQTFYCYSISNIYSTSQQYTTNVILNIFNPLTQLIFNVSKYDVKYSSKGNVVIYIPENISLNGQVISFNISSNTKDDCQLNNYLSLSNTQETNYTILTMYNNTLLLQNGSSLGYFEGQNNFSYNYQYIFKKCIVSSIFNSTLYSICENDTISYLATFQLSSLFFAVQQPAYQLTVAFKSVKKIQSINLNNSLVLGKELLTNLSQIYILNIFVTDVNITSVICSSGIQDFTSMQLPNATEYLLLYICENSLFYVLGNITNNTLVFDEIKHKVMAISKSFLLRETELMQIEILQAKYHEMLLLLTTSNITSFILTASYGRLNFSQFEFQLQDIIQTIPPYGNYNLSYNTMTQKGLIFAIFLSESERVYAVYDYSELKKSFSHPLLMQGGYNQSLPNPQSVVMNMTIVSNKTEGFIYDITNGTLSRYIVSNSTYISCQLKSKNANDLTLIGYNSFSQDSLVITFTYESMSNYWIYSLIFVVLIFFAIYIFVYWYNSRNFREENQYEELELEM